MKKTKPNYGIKKENTMGTTSDTGPVKKGYPKNTKDEDILEYLPYNKPGDPRLNLYYIPEWEEDMERVADPRKYKTKQQIVEEASHSLFEGYNYNIEKKIRQQDATTAKKLHQTMIEGILLIGGKEYRGTIESIDNYGNAIVTIKGTDIKGLLYNAKDMGHKPGEVIDLLFARKNKKGKLVFEFPQSPKDIVDDYRNFYADGMSQEDVIKQLIPIYGIKKVKEKLIGIIGESILDKTWKKLAKAA